VVALGGERTRAVEDVQRYLGRAPVGARVEATIVRGGQRLALAVTPTAAPE
jgi:S1-C subfamily serine protease